MNFSKGKKNGKGKEYTKNGEKVFEIEYLNGQRWKGIIEEYNENGELIFKGEYSNGQRWNGEG